jgi:hypothetical protein
MSLTNPSGLGHLLAVFASGERVEELERRAVPADQMTMPIRAAVGRAS